jgi:hypothetical protein
LRVDTPLPAPLSRAFAFGFELLKNLLHGECLSV